VKVWLINTGWTGGAYGTGSRIKYIYAMIITAALNGELDAVEYKYHSVLDLLYLKPDVPDDILNPSKTWSDETLYDQKQLN
jgi:phosphoenolpyruvate carboxykinase (ATP)